MSIELNPRLITTDAERLYLFRNSQQIEAQTGFQGYLRGDFDKGRDKFFSNFFPRKAQFDDGFTDALQEVMDDLRENGFLKSFSDMSRFCSEEADAGRIETQWATQYGVRIEHKGFTFMMRLCPKMGDYHVWVYCYRSDWLNQHMEKARSGIRFIDCNYQEQFRLEDGGRIRVTSKDGSTKEFTCRYIDDYHVEIGDNLFHICEFADRREDAGDKVEPIRGNLIGCQKDPEVTEVYETPVGEVLCGRCGHELECNDCGDMPDICPECGAPLNYSYYEGNGE